MLYATIFVTLVVIWISLLVAHLNKNYKIASKSGLPVVVTPFNPDNPLWLLAGAIAYRPLSKILPPSWFVRIKPTCYGWEFKDRGDELSIHDLVGESFFVVTGGEVEFVTRDSGFNQIICAKHRNFVPLKQAAYVLGMQGPNILTSSGDNWAKQRRLIAPNLNERISAVVWHESASQAKQMREWLFNQPGAESDRCIEGLKTIAENVLSHSGYGQVRPWKSSEEHKKTETLLANMTFFEAVGALVSNLILSAAVPMSVLTLPFLPRTFRRTGEAAKQYARLASELLGHEKELEAKNNAPRDNFAAMLNRVAASGSEEEKSHQLLLTDDEIRGNLYIFSAAGFETTANNMAFALALLAAYPKWQTWIQDELDEVFADVSDSDLGDYEKIFPRLQRCLAVMYETLRLYPPIVHLLRSVDAPQTVTTSKGTVEIPCPSRVNVNLVSLHVVKSVWGEDALEFKPSRWIPDSASEPSQSTAHSNLPPLKSPPRGYWMAWSSGPRNCPGQKMSQVEFTAVMATLFRNARAEPVCRKGETKEQARKRLFGVINDSTPVMTLQMNKPRNVKLKWTRR